MGAYYNEHDPQAAQWLRNLIAAGHIADGDVDERSIVDVRPDDLRGFTQCHFFAGIGVWAYALRCAGWADDRPVWTGSCPCQPFSAAGKSNEFADERHLWPAWFRLIRECRPVVVFGEQVSSKDALAWFDLVSADLEGAGYAVGALDTCAAGVGAPHIRQRLYFVADDEHARRGFCGPVLGDYRRDASGDDADGCGADGDVELHRGSQPIRPTAETGAVNGFWRNVVWLPCRDGKARPVEPGTFPLVDGTPARVVRLRGYGNAICAPQAAAFVEAYVDACGGV